MNTIHLEFPATRRLTKRAHVGVVGSGDLEILLEPSEEPFVKLTVRTGTTGFDRTWQNVLERFFEENDVAANIKINDFGATPGVVKLRLAQALEVSQNDVEQLEN
ncbi:malonate decarboxylase subunit delta [Pseudalkalibacillus salsuginis]|uniref:malonate decarboxylase subunit delta n=1 Tax=Pseudalkalibacillus salsuginis TaxID=2910972 RepID=UPI001F3ADBEF|nr:malonate decarboxylase subunit delta [Pseudalkalibacillus salsuginis]MCF6409607.1 malonate decarboxylase subunit delta [Pseudalkalibacillus salsuginis]